MVKNVDSFDLNSLSKKIPIEYILEVDVEYPDELHVSHKKLTILYDMLSNYCKKLQMNMK